MNYLGKTGEDLAVDYLKNQGFEILERNYKNKIGEIDIIGRESGFLVFIEVKARKGADFGIPFDSIGAKKQKKVALVAAKYIQEKKYFGDWRIDAVSVLFTKSGKLPLIELVRNAVIDL
jgi:putative endonuclease